MDLASFDIRRHRVEQRGKLTDQPRLGLTAQTKQNEIVSRKNGVYNLRNDAVFITHNARKDDFAVAEPFDEIFAEHVL